MRASVALLLAGVFGFLMLTSLGMSAQQTESAAVDNGTQESAEAYNMTTQLYDSAGQAFGPALVWGGIASFVLIALAFLVGSGGGR